MKRTTDRCPFHFLPKKSKMIARNNHLKIMDRKPSLKYLLWLQASQNFAVQLVMSVLYPFLKQHFSFADLSLQSAIQYSLPLLILPWIRTFWIRRFILLAFVAAFIRISLASTIDTRIELYIAAILAGCMLVFFWVPYEIIFFRSKMGHGVSSAWYFSVGSIISVIAPVMAGLMADHVGYANLYRLGMLMLIIPIILALKLPEEKIQENLKDSLRSLQGIRHLIFLDGFFLSANIAIISLSLLTFTKTATTFGAITSLATLMATLVSFIAAQHSDKQGNRLNWLINTSFASALLLLALGWQTSLWPFSIILIFYTSIRTLAQPLLNALPMDLHPDHTKLYIARQFLINLGRVLGFSLTWLCALKFGLKPMYALYALMYIVYIFCLRYTLQKK